MDIFEMMNGLECYKDKLELEKLKKELQEIIKNETDFEKLREKINTKMALYQFRNDLENQLVIDDNGISISQGIINSNEVTTASNPFTFERDNLWINNGYRGARSGNIIYATYGDID